MRSILTRILVLAAVVLWTPFGRAATPAEELLRLVPEDTGLCLVVQNLRGQASALAESDFVRRFAASPLGKTLAGDAEFKKLAGVDAFLQKQLGLSWSQLRDDILGDAVVFAYRPGPPGKMEQEEQALLLLKARDARLLETLIERLNRAQKDAGDLKALEGREYQGQKYYRREEKQRPTFYYQKGPLLVFTWQEETLRRSIDLERAATLAASPIAERLRAAGASQHVAALCINPRAFDADLEQKAAAAKPEEAAVLQVLRTYWKAFDGLVLSLHLDKEAELALTVQSQAERLPAAARRFLAEASRSSELWQRFPAEPLFAFAGRFDLAALVEMLGEFLPREARDAARTGVDRNFGDMLGRDLFKDVLPALGPDLGFCLAAPPSGDKNWFPHAVFALRVQPTEAKIDQAIFTAVQGLAQLAVLAHNQKNPDRLSLKSVAQGQVQVKYLDNERLFPPGLQPAFALQNGYLVLASSPQAIERLGPASPRENGRNEGAGDVPLVRISFKAWRDFLQQRREPIIAFMAERDKISKEEAGQRLEQVQANLQYVDHIELSHRATPGQVTLTLRVRTAWALK
jgi:hypothetical protein